MGQDKARLPYRGRVLVEHVAGLVRESVDGQMAIIGDPESYQNLSYPVHADLIPNCGPLGGIVTALHLTKSDWNLVVACDMPRLDAVNLRQLVERALRSRASCIAAEGTAGELEPLCAVYHRRCLAALDRALGEKRLKMKDLLPELQAEPVAFPEAQLANVNTPEDWTALDSR
jgi:molybdopterin-guanine dinucleotide biosynthesis protein A